MTHSFAAATSVLMADGSSKPISHVAAGDKVATAVPGGEGKKESHTVERVIVTTTDHDFVDLTIAAHDAHGHPASVGTVTTTDHHPFYDVTRAAFVDATNLKPGDRLQQPGGHTATVLQVRRYQATQTTYDLTINDLHTYYVEAGSAPVLVHNCNGAYDWETGRTETDNQPQRPVPHDSWIARGEPLQEGEYQFVVMRDGSLRAMNTDDLMALGDEADVGISGGAGHTSLSEGEPVHMAGTFNANDSGEIFEFGNWSGHYMPRNVPGYASLEDVSRAAFARHGLLVHPRAAWAPMP